MVYVIDTNNDWMALWNNTAIPKLLGGKDGASEQMWRPTNKTVDGNTGYVWNVSIPSGLGAPGGTSSGSRYRAYEDRVVGISWNTSQVTVWGLSLEEGDEGDELFRETWQPPAEWEDSQLIISYAGATNQAEDGIISLWSKEQRRYYGFSTETGKYQWETQPEQYLQAYVGTNRAFAHGRLYSTGVAGRVYCYNITDGERLWTYKASDHYNEILWANNWWMELVFITDGKVYMGHSEHSPIDPKPRGAPFICLDAETGDVIWRADGLFRQTHWGATALIGDSIIATMDTYDQQIYGIGKGPSKTTVTTPDTAIPQGSSITIKGTVLDQSPGTEKYAQTSRFPNGVPCVADEDISEWMGYVYKQFPRPDVTGVPVKLEAIGPNGNYVDLGTTTTDSYGNYGFQFEPDLEGKYTIIATFQGSKAYYGSASTTYLSVDPAPAETVSPTEQPQWYEAPPETVSPTEQPEWYQKPPDYTMLFAGIIIAVIVAIVLVLVDLRINWAMRKQR